jgi:hypothetical protein
MYIYQINNSIDDAICFLPQPNSNNVRKSSENVTMSLPFTPLMPVKVSIIVELSVNNASHASQCVNYCRAVSKQRLSIITLTGMRGVAY